jgi:tRNA A-37 threonylcarbamoyl transferase component Bud32
MAETDDILARRARARVGQVVREKWRLERLLGVGGMAAVYEASHRNGKRVAVKWLHNELTIDSSVRARFLREGYIANKVGHAGAVSVLDDETADDGALVLVMELLEGETIDARRARLQRLPPDDVLVIAHQVLDVLAAAHANGIVHRDLKPENLFVTRGGTVKVLDFGIARLRELHTATSATISRASLGTPGFMPPEQARGRSEEVDGRTDLWALGATMFQLLTGRHVHEAATVNEQLLAAMTAPAPAIQSVGPDMPDPVARVVDRALAFDKAERWEDAREMQLAVREAYRQIVGTTIAQAPMMVVPTGTIPADLEEAGPLSQTLPASATDQPTTGRSVVSANRVATTAAGQRRLRARWLYAAVAVAVAVAGAPVAFFAMRPARAPAAPSTAASMPTLSASASATPASAAVAPSAIAVAGPPPDTASVAPPSASHPGAPTTGVRVRIGSAAAPAALQAPGVELGPPAAGPPPATAPAAAPAPPASVDPLDRRR